MPDDRQIRPAASRTADIDAFLRRAEALEGPQPSVEPGGRLIFALDATMSRQPTWDAALAVQGRMFETAAGIGDLAVQLVYFRGFRECRASPFVTEGAGLRRFMSRIAVEGGNTQIGRVLRHARDEARRARVGALVFVGDCVEERVDPLCALAGELSLLGTRAFMFHEGGDRAAERAFREIARLTGGAYAAFDASAPDRLAALLSAAAAYAAGGRLALERGSADAAVARTLLAQMR